MMIDTDHDEPAALRLLVDELRARLPALTERQVDDIGIWMLKALWLGAREPPMAGDELPALRVIQGDVTSLDVEFDEVLGVRAT